MPKITCVITAFILTFYCLQTTAQTATEPFYQTVYTAEDGLPDRLVSYAIQDKSGYVWIATYGGVSRFDGKHFYNYGLADGMPDIVVRLVFEDKQDRIWVTTRKGIGYIKNNRYYHTAFNDSLEVDDVSNLKINRFGKIWAFTKKGLYEWDEKVWVKKNLFNRWKDEPIRSMLETNEGTYFILSNHFIWQNRDNSYKIIDSNFTDKVFYYSLRNYDGDFFLLTAAGLSKLEGKVSRPVFEKELKDKKLFSIFRDSKKRMWVSTRDGELLVSAPGDMSHFLHRINTRFVTYIYEDREQNIWVTDFYKGLIKIQESFFSYKEPGLINKSPFPSLLWYTSKKQLWTYTQGQGFSYYNGTKFIKSDSYSSGFLKVAKEPDDLIMNYIQMGPDNSFWAVSRSSKLFKINASGTTRININDENGQPQNISTAFYQQKLNRMLVCADKLYEYKEGNFIEIVTRNGVKINNAKNAFLASNGNIMLKTQDSKLYIITKDGYAFYVNSEMDLPDFFPESGLVEAPDNSLWIATRGNGLRRYEWKSNNHLKPSFKISMKEGLPNNTVTGLEFDKYGRAWIVTLSGIAVLESPKVNEEGILPLSIISKKSYRLRSSDYTLLGDALPDSTGSNIWIASTDGFFLFSADKFGRMIKAPQLNMEKVTVNMQETDLQKWSDSLTGFFEIPLNLQLPNNKNTFAFRFKGISFSDEGDIYYSYRIKGFDNIWSQPFTDGVINLFRFNPGNYTIEVKAKKANSNWCEPVSFSFTVKPPWWNTWWTRIAGVLLVSFTLILIFRRQVNNLQRKAAVQNQLRELELKALKAQMNPHFIYNALNSIQSLVIDKRTDEAQDYIVKFSRLLRQVLNHSEENVITLEKELSSLKLYIELEALRLHYSLQYSINVDEHILTEKEKVPPLIIQPFVENALWHGLSDKQGEKKLTITITETDNWIICEVTDNGVGRKSKNENEIIFSKTRPRGMDITKARLAAYNNTDISETFSITDLLDETGNAAGTMVVLKFKR